jgi:hypothetical protein
VAGQVRPRPSVEVVGRVVQAAEVRDRMGLVDEDQRPSSWLGEVNCRNEEDHLAEDMLGVVELASGVHRTEEQEFVVVGVCCVACTRQDDHIGHQLAEVRKAQLAYPQEQHLRDLHSGLHRLKRQGHRSVP